MKMNNYLLKLSIMFNVLILIPIIFLAIHFELPKKVMEYFFNVPNINCINNTNIVMMGDSRINVNWNKLMDRNDIVAIHGGRIENLIPQVESVKRLQPKLCLIMVGINDMFWEKTPEKTFEDYKILIDELQNENYKIVVQSLLYVCPVKLFYKEQNREIDELNYMLKDYSMKNGIIYLNLNKSFSNDNYLIMKYSSDGVHISNEG